MDISKIKQFIKYDPETGVFKYRVNIGYKIKAGGVAGYVNTSKKNPARLITIDGKSYRASRIAWAMINGSIEDGMVVRHINGNTIDDRIANLYIAPKSQVDRENASKNINKVRGDDGRFLSPK